MIRKPKGTNDILPQDIYRWHYLENMIKEISAMFGYREIRTPIFESTDLFIRGVGDGTDIVDKEMYSFVDRGGRSMSLRPEGTASVARAYLEHSMDKIQERQKVYYIGPMFRYEKPQAGRFRQHYQFGLEFFGESSPLADVEVISLAYTLYNKLGIKNISINLNSVGCDKCRKEFSNALKKFLEINLDKLCEDCHRRYYKNPLRVFDCKNKNCKEILSEAPITTNYLCDECKNDFENVKHGLDMLGISYKVTPTLVRGLDYYTKTVFEVVSLTLGAQNAIGGGGRYNNLIEELDGPDIPAVGFAAGMERIILSMDNEDINIPHCDDIELRIVPIGKKALEICFRLAYDFRKLGVKTEMDYRNKSLKANLKLANKNNEPFILIVGDDELIEKKGKLKDMKENKETLVSLDNLENIIKIIRGENAKKD